MLININKSLDFKDQLNTIISLGIDTLKIQIITDPDKELFSIIKATMEEYVVITKEITTKGYIIYDNSITNPQTGKGTSVGRITGDMILLYGLNQIHQNETPLKILQNIFTSYTYIIRQLDFNIDVFGLKKDRISCTFNTSINRFHTSPREQLHSEYTQLSGIGTTNIVIPDNRKHKTLVNKIKTILVDNEANIQYVGASVLSTYKTFKIRDKNYTHILFRVQEQKHLDKINNLIQAGNYNIDFNPFFENGNHKDISLKSSKRSLIKHYNKFTKYISDGYDESIINEHIEDIVTEFKNQYITDEDEYDEFELQELSNWIRTEFVNQFAKSDELTFHPTQIQFLSHKVHQKTDRLKTRIFNIGQRGNKSRLHEYIKLNNTKSPKELYNLKAEKNNFYEYKPSVEDIHQTLVEFINKVHSF
jgi:hypothetical protein